jgi:hypothetical protein
VKKKVGLRYAMRTTPLDPSCVRGTHGRLPDSAADTPMVICSHPATTGGVGDLLAAGRPVPAAAVKDVVLGLQGLTTT